jgi:hypothetical protein
MSLLSFMNIDATGRILTLAQNELMAIYRYYARKQGREEQSSSNTWRTISAGERKQRKGRPKLAEPINLALESYSRRIPTRVLPREIPIGSPS